MKVELQLLNSRRSILKSQVKIFCDNSLDNFWRRGLKVNCAKIISIIIRVSVKACDNDISSFRHNSFNKNSFHFMRLGLLKVFSNFVWVFSISVQESCYLFDIIIFERFSRVCWRKISLWDAQLNNLYKVYEVWSCLWSMKYICSWRFLIRNKHNGGILWDFLILCCSEGSL